MSNTALDGCDSGSLLLRDAKKTLAEGYMRYPLIADEPFEEVHARLVAHGAATKLDLAALVSWKHVQNAEWMTRLWNVPNTDVRAITAAAFAPGLSDAERV